MLVLYAADSRAEKTADCNDDVSLPCTGAATTNFFSLTWYKVSSGSDTETGSVRALGSRLGVEPLVCFEDLQGQKRGDHDEALGPAGARLL